jgi:hypothetical protein
MWFDAEFKIAPGGRGAMNYRQAMIAIASSAVVIFSNSPSFAQKRTAYEAGLNSAKKRGYENPVCYAKLYEQYAQYNPESGTWRLPGRRGNAFKTEVFNKCGIAR